MQKIIAVLLGSVLLVPAAGFAQDSVHRSRLIDRFEAPASKPISETAVRTAKSIASSDAAEETNAAARQGGRGKRALKGALIGAGAGFLLVTVSLGCTQGGDCAPFQFFGMSIGAGIGAAVGALIK